MKRLLFVCVLACYSVLIVPFGAYQHKRQHSEGIGYIPNADVLRLGCGDQTLFVGAWLIGNAVSYYGGITIRGKCSQKVSPDYDGMLDMLRAGLSLDPYNMDGYYFAQATLVWDAGLIEEANMLLAAGMKYRYWDFYLPYFIGFNNAYFLKNYQQAAEYYRHVAELTGDSLSMRLTGRYLYEAGRTNLAISYLSAMVQGTRNEAIKKSLLIRLKAFMAVRDIEKAYRRYVAAYPGSNPDIAKLVRQGFLSSVPSDPYGGEFFIDESGRVRSTSNFSFVHSKKHIKTQQ